MKGECIFCPKICTAVLWFPASVEPVSLLPGLISLPHAAHQPLIWSLLKPMCSLPELGAPPGLELGGVVQWPPHGLAVSWEHPPPPVRLSSQDHSPRLSSFLFPYANAHLLPPGKALLSLCFSFSLQGIPWGYVARKWLWTWKGNSMALWQAGRATIHFHFGQHFKVINFLSFISENINF